MNRKKFIICFIVSVALNLVLYFRQSMTNENLKTNGIETVAYVKTLTDDQSSFAQKLKFTFNNIDKYYFVSLHNDTITGLRKSVIPLNIVTTNFRQDTIIYNKLDPNEYLFTSEFSTYSTELN